MLGLRWAGLDWAGEVGPENAHGCVARKQGNRRKEGTDGGALVGSHPV